MPTPSSELLKGMSAPRFELPATDGNTYRFDDVAGQNGTVIVFICNHCPYVLATLERMIATARELNEMGIGFAAICSNDSLRFPDDSFPRMVELARLSDFPFPYLHDATQSVARAFGAACTPDFFGFNHAGELQYRGRLDSAGRKAAGPDTRRELADAMQMIAQSGSGPETQHPSVGCSIKWIE